MHVAAMDCPAEEHLVRMRLADQPDVRDVGVDLVARTVTVTYDGPQGPVLEALRDLGLGAAVVEPPVDGSAAPTAPEGRRQRVGLVVALVINAAFFVGELAAGLISGSMGLVADSLDMLADASVYALSLLAVGRAVSGQKRLAAASGYLQLGLAVTGLVEVVRRAVVGEPPPDVLTMVAVSMLALVANVAVLVILHRVRGEGAHMQAAWIFTSNDVKVNALVIVAALLVAATGSAAPDLVVGGLVFLVVSNGARRIIALSR